MSHAGIEKAILIWLGKVPIGWENESPWTHWVTQYGLPTPKFSAVAELGMLYSTRGVTSAYSLHWQHSPRRSA